MLDRGAPLLAGIAVIVALVVFLPDLDDEWEPPPPPEPAFLAAWERSRTEELVVRSDFTRTFPDGREVVVEQRLVQRPPDDQLTIGGGTANGRIGGEIVRCSVRVGDDAPTCVEGGPAPPYDEVVAAELDELAELVDPDHGIYGLDADEDAPGCFTLTLLVDLPTPPYGTAARLCFDEATGALVDVRVERDEAVDRVEAVEVRTEVTAADLRADDLGESVGVGEPEPEP
jgi:hypothetical protein